MQQASLRTPSRKIAFLGDMLELGDREREDHEKLIRAAVDAADVSWTQAQTAQGPGRIELAARPGDQAA